MHNLFKFLFLTFLIILSGCSTNNLDMSKFSCRGDFDCGTSYSCRSKASGGTECRVQSTVNEYANVSSNKALNMPQKNNTPSVTPTKPSFSGWDKNGRLKSNEQTSSVSCTTDADCGDGKFCWSTTGGGKECQLKAATNETPSKPVSSKKDKSGHTKSNDKTSPPASPSITNSTILNEDTILCETDNLLPTKKEFLQSGSKMMTLVEKELEFNTFMLEMKRKYAGTGRHETGFGQSNYVQRGQSGVAMINELRAQQNYRIEQENIKHDGNSINQYATAVAEFSAFKSRCMVNKEPKAVEVLESKPASHLVKVKVKINNMPAEMWTVESHLTFGGTAP